MDLFAPLQQRRKQRQRLRQRRITLQLQWKGDGPMYIFVAEPAWLWDSQPRMATMLRLEQYGRIFIRKIDHHGAKCTQMDEGICQGPAFIWVHFSPPWSIFLVKIWFSHIFPASAWLPYQSLFLRYSLDFVVNGGRFDPQPWRLGSSLAKTPHHFDHDGTQPFKKTGEFVIFPTWPTAPPVWEPLVLNENG